MSNITVNIRLRSEFKQVTIDENDARALLVFLRCFVDSRELNHYLFNGKKIEGGLMPGMIDSTITIKDTKTGEEFSFKNTQDWHSLAGQVHAWTPGITDDIKTLEQSLATLDKSRSEDENKRVRNIQPQSFLSFSRTAKIVGMAAAIPLVAASIKYLHDKFTPK